MKWISKPNEAVYQIITKTWQPSPTLLLYLVSLMGGLGLPSFSDNLQLEKWQMINRLLQSDPGSNGGFLCELDGLRFPLARVDD